MLPRIKIDYANGALGLVEPSPDGLLGIITAGIPISGSFELHKPYILNGFATLKTLGITEANNPGIVKMVREFYAEAGEGVRVYLYATSQGTSMTDMLDYTRTNGARKLIEAVNGTIRGIAVSLSPPGGYIPTVTDGMNADVWTAIAKAQELGEWAASVKFAPVFVVIEGRDYIGDATALRDLTQQADNRVGVLIGDTGAGTSGAAIGLLAGRIAKLPVQRNIGRVADGAVNSLTVFVNSTAAELVDVSPLHDKGYISFRSFVGRSGYFFTDDVLATLPTDDYRFLTYRRTIDKAYRICYLTLLNVLLDEVPVTGEGKMMPALMKNWQGIVENSIASQMTAYGELSADPTNANDRGVECYIDQNQNVISTGRVNVIVRVRPFGYARYVDVELGFTVTSKIE